MASCTYITLTGDSPREGYCHAKYDPMVFHLLTSEFFAMGGYTRIDVVREKALCGLGLT